MYVIKMRTLICYFAVFAITLASLGIIKLHTESQAVSSVAETKTAAESEGDALPSALGEKKIDVPILMYHNIFRSSGVHGNYIIAETSFENDLKFLKDNGYTTVVMNIIDSFS